MKSVENTSQLIALLEKHEGYMPVFGFLNKVKHKFSMVDDSMDEVTELNLCEPMMASINDKYVLRTVREILAELREVDNKEKPLTIWEVDGDRYKLASVVKSNDEIHFVIENFNYL